MHAFSPGKLLLVLALVVSTMVGSAGVFAQDATPGAEPGASPAAGGEMAAPPLPPGAEIFADGLNNPRNITFGPDGALWIAEAGGVPEEGSSPCLTGPEGNEVCYNTTGSITRVLNGEQERVVEGLRSIGDQVNGMSATGPHDIAFTADGSMYLIMGLGADPASRAENEAGGPSQLGKLFLVDPESGELTEIADVAGFETTNNPDGGVLDSNPYAMVTAPDGSLAVVDAGANALYRVDLDGTISTLAIFPDRLELLPDESAEIPMNAVPDAVAIGADDDFYVGELTGFPFPLGGANVYRVNSGGGDPVLHSDGYTNIIDVAFAPNGDMYVLQIVSGGMANINPADPSTMAGDLIHVTPDNERTVLVSGLVMPTGLALGDDGSIYVTNMGPMAGAGQVLRFGPEGSGAPAATPEAGVAATPAA